MSWYDPTSWNVDWFGGNTAGKPPSQYQDRQQIQDVINQGLQSTANRAAPQAGTTQIATGPQDQFRGMQVQQANQLAGIANGQQMGAGELAARRAGQQAIAAQHANAALYRGGAAPAAALGAARNIVNIGGQTAGQAQQAALSDQANANQLLTSALGQGRSTDVGLATNQAQLNQGAQLANLQAQLQQRGLNDQQQLAYLQQLTGMDANQLQAQMAGYQVQKQSPGLVGNLLQAAGPVASAAIMASDERLKTDITDARAEVDELLDALKPVGWKYKDPKHGEGRFDGILAQDMERSAAGKHIVRDTPEGKMLDVNHTISALLASSARLNERVRDLEGKAV